MKCRCSKSNHTLSSALPLRDSARTVSIIHVLLFSALIRGLATKNHSTQTKKGKFATHHEKKSVSLLSCPTLLLHFFFFFFGFCLPSPFHLLLPALPELAIPFPSFSVAEKATVLCSHQLFFH